jgi:hypothetical protein
MKASSETAPNKVAAQSAGVSAASLALGILSMGWKTMFYSLVK